MYRTHGRVFSVSTGNSYSAVQGTSLHEGAPEEGPVPHWVQGEICPAYPGRDVCQRQLLDLNLSFEGTSVTAH